MLDGGSLIPWQPFVYRMQQAGTLPSMHSNNLHQPYALSELLRQCWRYYTSPDVVIPSYDPNVIFSLANNRISVNLFY
jgi:hypothetical protein